MKTEPLTLKRVVVPNTGVYVFCRAVENEFVLWLELKPSCPFQSQTSCSVYEDRRRIWTKLTDVKVGLGLGGAAEHLCSGAAPVTEQLTNSEGPWLARAKAGVGLLMSHWIMELMLRWGPEANAGRLWGRLAEALTSGARSSALRFHFVPFCCEASSPNLKMPFSFLSTTNSN